MDKRGTDKMLSIYWFLVLTLVAGGVFAMVYIFYGAPHDVREIESELLAQKLADCISKRGVIPSYFFVGERFNENLLKGFTERCNINFDVEEDYGDENEIQYFYRVNFYLIRDLNNPVFSVSDGNLNWEIECYVKKDNSKEYKRLAKCTESRFYAVDSKDNQYLIKILSAIGKSKKNVKQ